MHPCQCSIHLGRYTVMHHLDWVANYIRDKSVLDWECNVLSGRRSRRTQGLSRRQNSSWQRQMSPIETACKLLKKENIHHGLLRHYRLFGLQNSADLCFEPSQFQVGSLSNLLLRHARTPLWVPSPTSLYLQPALSNSVLARLHFTI